MDGVIKGPVTVKYRAMTVPPETLELGVESDRNAERVEFILPRHYLGTDLSAKVFTVDTLNERGEIFDSASPQKTVSADEIRLTWLVGVLPTSINGKVAVRIRAVSQNFVWQTEPHDFVLAKTFKAGDPPDEPYMTYIDQSILAMADLRDQAAAQAGIAKTWADAAENAAQELTGSVNAIKDLNVRVTKLEEQMMIEKLKNDIAVYGAKHAFEEYVKTRAPSGDPAELYKAVCSFYTIAKTGKIYGAEFPRFEVSDTSIGIKTYENAKPEFAVCTPGTNTTPAVDPYAGLALFVPININYKIGDDLEPVITAIEGVTPGFSLTNPDGLAGVMQMTAWAHVYGDAQIKGVKYSDTRIDANYLPLPEAVKAIDNTVRPFVVHAKYVAGKDANGLLTSASGLHPAGRSDGGRLHLPISHDSQIALWRQRGPHYCGGSLCDRNFLYLMFLIKYARLDSSGVMMGCNSYSYAKRIALGETGVKRVLLTPANAANYVTGSTISVGASDDRNYAGAHSVLDHRVITSIEIVSIGGTDYSALNVDTPDPFTTTTEHFAIAEPWVSGSTDRVKGNDGAPYDSQSSREPFKIQDIECMVGIGEILADTAIQLNAAGPASVWLNRRGANLAKNNAGTGAYLLAGTIPMPAASGWAYIAETGNSLEDLLVPIKTGASTSTAYRAGVLMNPTGQTGWRQWYASGSLLTTSSAGIPCVQGNESLSKEEWSYACRACGTGGNRGVFAG